MHTVERGQYTINRTKYPSVTTILGVINKPALIRWAANKERETIQKALLEVLTNPEHPTTPDALWGAVEAATTGVLASEKIAKEAADIGTAAHQYIATSLKQSLGLPGIVVPALETLPPESQYAVQAFQTWAESVDLKPISMETKVFHPTMEYAGTFDLIAEVLGDRTLIDIKTSKAVWFPEMGLQIVAYRAAATACGLLTTQGMIVRLPKLMGDPPMEAVLVPESITIDHFASCLSLYRLIQQMKQEKVT